MKLYAAQLLFRYRVERRKERRALCEARVIHLRASTPSRAISAAQRYGHKEAYSFVNAYGRRTHFIFVGLMELKDLTVSSAPAEV